MSQTSCCSESQHPYDEKATAMADTFEDSEVIVHDAPTVESPLVEYDRLTMLLNLHHQTDGDIPTSATLSLERLTTKDEEPYTKRLKVKPGEATEIDFGWLQSPGLVVVQNITNATPHKIPTDAEREEAEASFVVMRMRSAFDIVSEIITIRIGAFVVFELPPGLPDYDLVGHGSLMHTCRVYAFSR